MNRITIKITDHYAQDLNLHPESIIYIGYAVRALRHYLAIETQADGRTRRWVYVPEEDKYLRVIVLPDGETLHNAFWDRGFKRKWERENQ